MANERYLERVRDLCGLALRRLPTMIDQRSGLTVFRVDGHELVPAGSSVRYTAMTALGLERAAEAGMTPTVDVAQLHAALDRAMPDVHNSGDLGLLLWSAARTNKPLAERALRELMSFGELTRNRGGDAFHSTELAWVVTGLTEALAENVGDEMRVRARLGEAWGRLLANRGASGLMGFARERGQPTLRGRVRSELGFFDAQVYTIVASLRRYEVLGDPEALEIARGVGTQILQHQGELGQWAWHYNARRGRVVDLYPVYSVHQDGMAPMALLPLERLAGVPTEEAIARGVEWLFNRNELDVAMVNTARDTVWRSIRRRSPVSRIVFPLKAASLAGIDAPSLGTVAATPALLEIDRELRPYHLGWCLYAFAGLAAAGAAQRAA
jgi:hypothetical protein